MKKRDKKNIQPEKIILPTPKEHVLNSKTFSYKAISFENFHMFTDVFSELNQADISTPVSLIKFLFRTGSVFALMQLYLTDEQGNPPSVDFLKTVPPAQILDSLSDFFGSEGNLLLNGIFSLLKSIQ